MNGADCQAGYLEALAESDGYYQADSYPLDELHQVEAETTAEIPEGMPRADSRTLFISANDMLAEPVKIEWLIKGFIEIGDSGQIFGPSGHGKTFVALDWSCGVATGRMWNGHQCKQGLVLYFAGEGHRGLRRRVKAWSQHNKHRDLSNLQISRTIITFDAEGLNQVVAEIRQLQKETGKQVALIVVDTLARHLQGDENSTRDMSDFVRLVDRLRGAFPGSSSLVVHHTGNDAERQGRSRGSSVLKAAIEVEVQCAEGALTFLKMKDGELPAPVEFKLIPVQIGEDEDGEPITSCIVSYGQRSAENTAKSRKTKEPATKKLKGSNGALFDIVTRHPTGDFEEIRTKFYERETFRRSMLGESDVKQDTLLKAFKRALQFFIENGTFSSDGTTVKKGEPDKNDKPDNAGQIPLLSGIEAGQAGHSPYRGDVRVRSGQSGFVFNPDNQESDLPE